MNIPAISSRKCRKSIAPPRSWKGPLPDPAIRTAEDIRGVLARPDCTCTGPVYSMYRDVARTREDHAWIREQQIRFDITVIPPCTLCGEYVKTKGHYHPVDPCGTGYPEMYEVLSGEAHYLIQTPDCSDIALIAASRGDIVVVPSGYGHVTINPSKRSVLEMANIVSSRFSSEYQGYEDLHGAAYFEMASGEFIKNPAYSVHATLRFVKAQRITDTNDQLTDPLYELIRNRDPILEFLNYPEKYEAFFQNMYP